MRIIGGQFKGKRIQAPSNLPVRPTTDFAKEGLFNILHHKIDFESIRALDLFCGTGNLSYEMVSRGCLHVTAIDKDFRCVKFVSEQSKKMEANIQVFKADVFKKLSTRSPLSYDLIVADPPYDLEGTENIPNLILNNGWLSSEGILIIEHGKHTSFEEHPNFSFSRKYGNVNFSFFQTNLSS